jgi:hypothetical protein
MWFSEVERISGKQTKNMNTLAKTLGVLAGVALTTSVAHANMEVLENGGTGLTIDVTSTVSGSYLYTYEVDPGTYTGGINDFTVNVPNANLAEITGENAPAGFNAGVVQGNDEVNWIGLSSTDISTPLIFTFTSPLPPMPSFAGAQDDGSYTPISGSVLAPTVADGGMTMSLLGGALVGLGALRRKLGC